MRRILSFLLIFILCAVCLFGLSASAFTQNDLDYCINEDNEKIYISKTYEQSGTISYINGAESVGFLNPEDLFIDNNSYIYVADTGNNRIVKINKNGDLLQVYKDDNDPFYLPTGIFVDENGNLYIADSGNKRIVIMNNDGKIKKVIGKPDSDLLSDVNDFTPVKLAIGTTGYVG